MNQNSGCNQFRFGCGLADRGCRKISLWCRREVPFVDGSLGGNWRRDPLSCSSNHLLCFGCVGTSVLFHRFEALASVLSSQILDLVRLFTDDIASMFQMRVDQFLVFNVDQRCEEDNAGAEQRETPERKKFDEVVGDKRSEESLYVLDSLPTHLRWSSELTAAVTGIFSAKTIR